MGIHFTPTGLADTLAKRIIDACFEAGMHSKQSLRVLDPACGDGELLSAFAHSSKERNFSNLHIWGVDTDAELITQAGQRLGNQEASFIATDFLESVEKQHFPSLFGFDEPLTCSIPQADVIIANPPYVRTQHLGAQKAQALAKVYGLSGRIDLYHAFMIAMTHQLVPGGIIGVILSNRFLSTKGSGDLRSFLEREYDILEIIDLGDTKLFEAAVLPAIFLGRKKGDFRPWTKAKFVKIYETREVEEPANVIPTQTIYNILDNPSDGIYSIGTQLYKVTSGHLSLPFDSKDPWAMLTAEEREWVDKIELKSEGILNDIADIRVGIKTTADNVFIRSDWHALPKDIQPEKDILRPIVFQDAVSRWRLSRGDIERSVLYTHKMSGGKRVVINLTDYPRAARYLESHRQQLEGREYVKKAKRNWYEIWVPQQPSLWQEPKVIFADISEEPRFAYSAENLIVNGNCYWITLKKGIEPDILFFIMALANSSIMSKYHELRFQNKLYSGRKRYFSQYVERYPMPHYRGPEADRIIKLTKVLALSDDIENPEKCEDEINRLVAKLFGIADTRLSLG